MELGIVLNVTGLCSGPGCWAPGWWPGREGGLECGARVDTGLGTG